MQSDAKPRPSRWIRVLLALSLALNLLFVGLVAGAVWRHAGGPGARAGGPGLQSYATPYIRALPRAERRTLRREIGAAHPRLGRKARREDYARMLTALRADPFDKEAVAAVLEDQRTTLIDVQATAQTYWLRSISEMSGPDRQAYADRLEELIARPNHRRRGRQRNAD